MADYAKMKNAELEALLKERNLPHTGKKADLVKRLQDADAASSEPAKKDEDEIDWDDEQPSAPAPASKPAAAPVPEKKSALKPAAAPAAAAPAAEEPAPAAPAAPAKDFTAGLAPTALDEEIARRRARAAKFGLDPEADETLKSLERANKFGTTDAAIVSKMDSALPDRREKKRGREQGEDGGARAKKPAVEGKEQKPAGAAAAQEKKNGAPGWMSEADRAKAEARKAKFATAT